MNLAQKKIIIKWVISLTLLICMMPFASNITSFIEENPLVWGLIIISSIFFGSTNEANNLNFTEMMEDNPWIKKYIPVICIAVIVVSFLSLTGYIEQGNRLKFYLMIGFILIFLPFGIAILIKQLKNAENDT